MSTFELVINKYSSTSPKVSFEEFIEDIHKFNPTFVPFIDISIMTTLGAYLNNLRNHYKWKICTNLNCQINNMIRIYSEQNDNIFVNFDENIINNICMIQKENNKDPSSSLIQNDIFDILNNIYKKKIIHIDPEKYLNFRCDMRTNIRMVFDKYTLEFNELDKKEENIQDMLGEKYSCLEENSQFIDACNFIEKLKDLGGVEINKILITYSNLIKENCINFNSLQYKSFTDCDTYQEKKNIIKKDFSNHMDIIYKQVIKSNNIDDTIAEALVYLFDCEKSMYLINISLDEIEIMFKNF